MPLTQQQIEFWEANSYLKIPKLLAEDSRQLSEWADEVAVWPSSDSKWLHFFEMHTPENLSRIENFLPFHSGLNSILNGSQLTEIVSELMQEPAVIYKDRINFKYPKGGAHAAHQDGVAYESSNQKHFSTDAAPFISVLIAIDYASIENGCFQVATNWPTNHTEILPLEFPDPEFPNFSKITQTTEDALNWQPIETEPGDAILFTERLPHRSTANHSNKPRRILYGVYNPASVGDLREQYYSQKRLHINDSRYMVGNPHAPVLAIDS